MSTRVERGVLALLVLLGLLAVVLAVGVAYPDAPLSDQLIAATVMSGYGFAAAVRFRRRPHGAATAIFVCSTIVFSCTWLLFPWPPVYQGRLAEAGWVLGHNVVFFGTSALFVHLCSLVPEEADAWAARRSGYSCARRTRGCWPWPWLGCCCT